jgi:Uma2 family endonuclease
MATTQLHTVESFEQLVGDERVELIRGELREMAPPAEDHGHITREVVWRIENFIRPRGIEKLFIETSFIVSRESRTVLVPDVAFVDENRLDPERDSSKFVGTFPDLAISSSERRGQIQDKVGLYLRAGIKVVLLIDPRRRTVRLIRPDQPEVSLALGDELDLSDVIAGFTIPVSVILG